MADITEVSTDFESLNVKEESVSGDERLIRKPSTRSARPKWRPEELQAQDDVAENDQDATVMDDKALTSEELQAEAPKRRGRATRSALGPAEANVVAQQSSRPVRKNVRASRRMQAAAAETTAEGDESLLG